MADARVLAADVGGTSLRVALVDARGRILARREARTPADGAAGLDRLASLWASLGTADGRAIAIAGAITREDGVLTQSPNLPGWEGLRPGAHVDASAVNDATAAATGEAWRGALRGVDAALLVTLGTGVGGGLVLGGRPWAGRHGAAGEVGHVTVWPDGPACPCGNRGCLERYASATAVAEAAGASDGVAAEQAARGGDAGAVAAFERAGEALGIVLAGVLALLDLEALAFSGGLAGALDLLRPTLEREIHARAFRLVARDVRIVRGALGDDAGLLGAARVALDAAGA
jgi:glucokinase